MRFNIYNLQFFSIQPPSRLYQLCKSNRFLQSVFQLLGRVKGKININEPSTPLGRWKIDYCTNKMDQKIDLSNEDHCGPCGQYRIMKNSKK